jgi:hypothetical protein
MNLEDNAVQVGAGLDPSNASKRLTSIDGRSGGAAMRPSTSTREPGDEILSELLKGRGHRISLVVGRRARGSYDRAARAVPET